MKRIDEYLHQGSPQEEEKDNSKAFVRSTGVGRERGDSKMTI